MSKHNRYLFFATAAALALGAHAASASVLTVGTCTGGDHFDTIQAAVDAALSGDVVQICPGSYPEQVLITLGVTLEKVKGMAKPVVAVPAGGVVANTTRVSGAAVAAQIAVAPAAAANVTIKGLIVDGTGNNLQACSPYYFGIYYKNAGGTIKSSTAKNQQLSGSFQGCGTAVGILVENDNEGTGAVTIAHNTVNNFDKGGIVVEGTAANVTVSINKVTGIGPTDVIAQNGIQVSYGATGTVDSNKVSNLIYTPATYGSSGILLFDMQAGEYQAPSVVENNIVSSSQYGINLDAVNGTADGLVQVTGNKVSGGQFSGIGLYSDSFYFDPPLSDDYINVANNRVEDTSPYDGIDVCSDNNTITGNRVINSPTEAAIHLDGLCTEPDLSTTGVSNTVSGNKLTVACVGILSGPAEGTNTIQNTHFIDVNNKYVYNQDSYSCDGLARQRPARHRPAVSPLMERAANSRRTHPVAARR